MLPLPQLCCCCCFGCDRYTLDLLGELSAFDGELLAEQTAFALVCLEQLRGMYSGSSSSSSSSSSMDVSQLPDDLQPQVQGQLSSLPIVLVGHSMGGVVARAAAAAAWKSPWLGEQQQQQQQQQLPKTASQIKSKLQLHTLHY
jgi:hypothetical protein